MRAHSVVHQLRTVLEMIKIEHTLFALPFAFMGMLLAAGGWPPWRTVVWIAAAMVGARSAAMGWNRLVDRRLDAANPGRAGRAVAADRGARAAGGPGEPGLRSGFRGGERGAAGGGGMAAQPAHPGAVAGGARS